MTTWHQVQQDIKDWAISDYKDGSLTYGNLHEWAQDTADGCEYTIYYHHQIALWTDSDYVRSFEDIIGPTDNIQEAMGYCVFLAIEEECRRISEEVVENYGELVVSTTERHIAVDAEGGRYHFSIPVLTHTYE